MKPALRCFRTSICTFLLFMVLMSMFTGNYKDRTGINLVEAAAADPQLRVGISLLHSYVDLSFEADYRLVDQGGGVSLDISPGRYRFYRESGGVKVVDMRGFPQGVFAGPLLLEPVASPAYDFSFQLYNAAGGNEYRGALEIIGDNKGIVAVNIIDREYYLKGVVPCEMPSSWGNYGGMEALKAQAVAARTYALYNQAAKEQQHFHLCDTELSQVYGGKGSETPNTNRAVEETKGEILLYNGSLIQPFYHATSGGYTELSENVWSSSMPYLASMHDPYDDPDNPMGLSNMVVHRYARWETAVPASNIAAFLRENGYSISGELEQITIASTFPSGRVQELRIHGDGGNISLLKERARTALGLRSQYFSVKEELEGRVWVASSTNGVQQKELLSEIEGKWVVSGQGTKKMLTGTSFNAVSEGGSMSKVPAKSFIIEGKGWGHGVGMSQNGAYNRSRAGYSYQEILSFYYPGTALSNTY